jgi:hypothetical protein
MLEQFLLEFFVGIGTIAFAISGSFKAIRHELDVLGVLVLGFVTALGGGLVRDALLHTTPAAFLDLGPAIYALIGCLIAIAANAAFKGLILPLARPEGRVFLALDAIGLAAFTVLGAKLAAEAGLNSFGIVLQYADRDRQGNIDIGYPAYFVINQSGSIELKNSGWDKTTELDDRISRLLSSAQNPSPKQVALLEGQK